MLILNIEFVIEIACDRVIYKQRIPKKFEK